VTRIEEVAAITAFIQALVAKLILLRQQNQSWRVYRGSLIAENKWRALKDGVSGQLIDFGREEEIPVPELMEEALGMIEDVADELDSREEIEYIRTILEKGTSADRQLQCYRDTGSMLAVVDQLSKETVEGT